MAITGRYIFSGSLGGSEVFAYSWAFTQPTWTDASQAVGAGAVWVARYLSVNGGATVYAPHVIHNSVRAVAYNPDGTTASAFTLPITAIPGTSTGDPNSLPFEVSPCVTMRTATNTRRGRGRFYLPPPVRSQVGGQGVWNSSFAATGSGSQINALAEAMTNVAAANSLTPVVISQATGSITTFPVTQLEIGNVPDAQRRRRNRLTETRVVQAV